MKYIIPFDYVTLRAFLVTATRYNKQDLIATGLREITLRMIIIIVCINAHGIIVQCDRCNSY